MTLCRLSRESLEKLERYPASPLMREREEAYGRSQVCYMRALLELERFREAGGLIAPLLEADIPRDTETREELTVALVGILQRDGRGEEALRENCWRYDKMCGTLGSAGGDLDWPESMALLKGCEQEGTTWSVVFSPEGPELWFSVHKEWDSVYHLAMP